MDIIQRNGEAWQRQPDGTWFRFDMASGTWLPSAVPPPPPPPPPGADPYFPLPKRPRRMVPDVRALVAGLDRRVLVVALVVLIALFGIGGAALLGGDAPSPAAASIPLPDDMSKKARFIRQADAVCARMITAVGKLRTPADLGQMVQVLRQARDGVRETYRQLSALKPPKKARGEWKRYLGSPADLQIYDDLLAAAERGDVAALAHLNGRLQQESRRKSAIDRWAMKYGFKVCSQEQFEA